MVMAFDALPRRVKFVPVSIPILGGMLVEGREDHLRVARGIPSDADVVGAFVDDRAGTVYLVVHHPDYPPVEPGATPEELSVTFEWFDCAGL